jgi:hypothetical protein
MFLSYFISLLSAFFERSGFIHFAIEIIVIISAIISGFTRTFNFLVFCFITGFSINALCVATEFSLLLLRKREESRRIQQQKEKYFSILEGWRREGYNVSGLGKILEEKHPDFSKIEAAFEEYGKKISKLKALEKELNWLVSTARSIGLDFNDRVSQIREMLRDPSRLSEVESAVSELKEELAVAQARLKVDAWREKGYDVSKLYELLESRNIRMVEVGLKEYEEAATRIRELGRLGYDVSKLESFLRKGEVDKVKYLLNKFNKIVQEISELEKDIQMLGEKRLAEEVQILKKMLGDLSNIEEAEEYVLRLRRRVAEAIRESKIKPWERKLDEWQRMGYDLSWLRPDLGRYSLEVEEKLRKYEKAIQEIQQLKKSLEMFKITAFNFEIFLIEKKLVKGEDIDRVLEEISSVRQKAYSAIKVEADKSLGEMLAKVEKFIEELSTR